ncbi:MAG TPA: DNA-directed RNA polymerase subunit beta [bacterium]|nr:DNA-directed RNA polymerase subunit beta [bacterium]
MARGADQGRIKRESYSRIPEIMELPNLMELQKRSYEEFLQQDILPEDRKKVGLQAAFTSVFPIYDSNENSFLEFAGYSFGEPRYSVEDCQERDMTFAAPLKVTLRLVVREEDPETRVKKIKDIREQEVFFCELPLMTDRNTFIINGAERVIVSQLHRSPGVSFDDDDGKVHGSGKRLFTARVIPYRGSWLEFEFDANDLLYARIDRKRKILATLMMRCLGYNSDEKILALFYEKESLPVEGKLAGRITATEVVDPRTGEVLAPANAELTKELQLKLEKAKVKKVEVIIIPKQDNFASVRKTLEKDSVRGEEEALLEIYRKLRPGDPPTLDSARNLWDNLFFNARRYDLAKVGRYKLNKKLKLDVPLATRVLTKEDLVEVMKYLLQLNNGHGDKDDIDHLGNRRVRSAGELLENQFRLGLVRIEKAVKERMSILDMEEAMPANLINAKPVTAGVREFFGSSQLSQFMDQTNPLAALTHKRRLSALGPGGLNRERAGFEVRDVHHTHYGRVCPIETPEGPNIGLIVSLSTYARVNEYGFIETPYRKVEKGRVTDKIDFLSADEEDAFVIAQANLPLDDKGRFKDPQVLARHKADYPMTPIEDLDYMDISPKQLVSVATALIPFLEHDDANRALMGSNMQRQAVPLLQADPPFVGTGMEFRSAYDSGAVILAKRDGVVEYVDATKIVIAADVRDEGSVRSTLDTFKLTKYKRSNQDTSVNQKPLVRKGQKVRKGQVIADGPASRNGELALGKNVLVAFMPWNGYNYEDAIILSERLVSGDVFTSIHIEEFELEARDTKLGKEEITRDIPNVGEEALKDLDETGIVRIGADVAPGDILVGKVTPKGETELTPEEKLLRAIFGEKAGDVRDASLKTPPGVEGKIIDVRVFARHDREEVSKKQENELVKQIEKKYDKLIEAVDKITVEGVKAVEKEGRGGKEEVRLAVDRIKAIAEDRKSDLMVEREKETTKIRKGDELPPGVIKLVKVYIAKKRKISVGDKMAGRHGNKGVVSKIVPIEDLPYLSDGTPVDIVLNPLGVPSRMNVGQILETQLGYAARALGIYVETPVFDGAREEDIHNLLAKAGLPTSGRSRLIDGKTGEAFDQEVTVGIIYMLKLAHLVDDKIHARSIGPYSLITQQPLGGKAQFGGQRFGEMEVWALEAYGAAYTLQELLTVKSDDVAGRTRIYEAIVKGKNAPEPGVPESFNVLVKELQALALDVELLKNKE